MLLDDDEAAVVGRVAQWRGAAHPHAACLGGRNLVADTLGGNLALELSKG